MKRILLGGMATSALLVSGLAAPAAASVAADYPAGNRDCASSAPAAAKVMKGVGIRRDPNTLTRSQIHALESQSNRVLARAGLDGSAGRLSGSVKIPVDFHVVTDRNGHGRVSKARIDAQIRVLNNAYSGRTSPRASDTPFRFRLDSISHTQSTRWYTANPFADRGFARINEMKQALHVGNALHLNLYTVGFHNKGLLGFAQFPLKYLHTPKADGVVLLDESLPGGNANGGPGFVYNRGDTATHEVGHWLNLYHTFQDGCNFPNDYVGDTPPQDDGKNIFYCRTKVNTCGPRTDPVHNFMNYADDVCLDRFTHGQRLRMDTGWLLRQALSN